MTNKSNRQGGPLGNRYKPSLSSLMNLCAVNYMLMLRLVSEKETVGQTNQFFISDFLSYSVTVKEVTRYTSLVSIAQDATILGQHLAKFIQPSMIVRLYHDAQMAEVIKSQDVQYIKPKYTYPNDAMHQPDEKQQVNQFLKEWLQLCHQFGQTKLSMLE